MLAAGEIDTRFGGYSLGQHERPSAPLAQDWANRAVRANARTNIPRFSRHSLDFSSLSSIGWYAHTNRIWPVGVLGDPKNARLEQGEVRWLIKTRTFVEPAKHLTGIVSTRDSPKRILCLRHP